MNEAGVGVLWLAGIVGLLIGAGIAIVAAWMWQRRRGNDSALEELQSEFDTYRASVDRHFAETSALFRDLTERYRGVYDHLAHGAQQFCAEGSARALDMAERELLATARDETPADVAPPDEALRDEATLEETSPEAEETPVSAQAGQLAGEESEPRQPTDYAMGEEDPEESRSAA